MSSEPIYLDHQSTTPCDPDVVEAMLPFLTEAFGNAASRTHAYGWRAAEAVETARADLAALIGADARDMVFTSGATEANNLAILGVAPAHRDRGDHVVSCQTEHRAVLDPLIALEKEGFRVTRLPVSDQGRIDLDQLANAIDARTTLVTLMHANNEIGTLHPLAEIGAMARERGVLFHSDASQSAGKVPVDVRAMNIDLLSFTAHKLYGPKGIGALYLRRRPRIQVEPLMHGGGHERGLRPGTLPVALCVGFGRAAQIAAERRESDAAGQASLRDELWERLRTGLESVEMNGAPEDRLPGNLNASFLGVEGEALLMALPELALSSGSACSSAVREPSHVLRALGIGEMRAMCSLRFGIGRGNTLREIETAAERLIAETRRLRKLSPHWR